MAWIYLAESEGFNSAYHHGFPQSLIVKQTDTAKECFYREWKPETSQEPQYGMMLEPSQGIISRTSPFHRSLERLISFPAASPARTSASRELEEAWKESEADLYLTSSGSLANADPDSFSWKTSQLSLFGGLTGFSWNSMRWGLMQDGQLFQPRKWEPRTSENESGYWPTPLATDGTKMGHGNLGHEVKRWPTATARDWKSGSKGKQGNSRPLSEEIGGQLSPMWVEWLMGYPIGWTELSAWATAWFRKPRGKPSKDCVACNEERR